MDFRMYFFVPYNLSPIQQGIQAGHCALEYAVKYGRTTAYEHFIAFDKTWVILNGGTTRDKMDKDISLAGTMNQYRQQLSVARIPFADFIEPDLNYALTALCFLCNECVYDYENHLDIREYLEKTERAPLSRSRSWSIEEISNNYIQPYQEWVEYLGGADNVFLRNLLRGKKLA